MKSIKTVLLGFFLISNLTYSQIKLDIKITGIRNNKGNIMLQLFNEKEEVIAREMSRINNYECTVSIENLKPGKYAIRYYHDENLNGKMETNIFGKPAEGYGFSNNVIGISGPPPFEKWIFNINHDTIIVMKPTY
jgi:uncharacterized protein (DUF2141 family)